MKLQSEKKRRKILTMEKSKDLMVFLLAFLPIVKGKTKIGKINYP